MKLFENVTAPTAQTKVVLLGPAEGIGAEAAATRFAETTRDCLEYEGLLAQAQRLRGRIYLGDGAIEPWQLTDDGRHLQTSDRSSYHLLVVDQSGEVLGCTRILAYPNTITFDDLGSYFCPLVHDQALRPKLEEAINREIQSARGRGFSFVEVGGWAIAEQRRCTVEAVRMVATVYALGDLLGGAVGISTVTTRHGSSCILKRLGGSHLASSEGDIGPYYDPQYRCEMELLRFDSTKPSQRYTPVVRNCRAALAEMRLILPSMAPEYEAAQVEMTVAAAVA